MKLNVRLLVTLLLGFASGLPLALSNSTLQAWLTETHISIITIGWFTLVGQPYLYKFLWAPLLDRYIPPFFGRRRGWIALMQIAIAITLLCMSVLQPQYDLLLLGLLAILLSFFSATQDIAIDAYRTDVLKEDELGTGSALYTIGYRLGMMVSGGFTLIIASFLGWHITYLAMAIIILLCIIVAWFGPEPDYLNNQAKPIAHDAPTSIKTAIAEPLRDLLSKPAIGLILSFLFTYKFGEALATALTTNFLLRQLHFSLVDVGTIYKSIAIIAVLAGAFVSGLLYKRIGLWRSLWYFGIAQALPLILYVCLAITGKNYSLMITAVGTEAFSAGLGSTSLTILLMKLCNKRYTATQFALLSAIPAIDRVFTGPLAGVMVVHWGWTNFFTFATLCTVPGLLLVVLLRKQINSL